MGVVVKDFHLQLYLQICIKLHYSSKERMKDELLGATVRALAASQSGWKMNVKALCAL